MALGLLRKQKFMGRLAFLLSIGIYHPPATLESNLDFLIAHSRPKLRSMAADVKARCKLYGLISQDLITSLELLCALLQPKGSSRHLLEQQMTQAQALASSLLANLLKRGALPDASAPALTPVRDLVARSAAGMQNLPVLPGMDDDKARRQETESARQSPMEQLRDKISPQNLPGRARVVDTGPGEPERESTQIAQPGRHAGDDASPNLPDAAAQVDSVPQVHGLESTQTGSSGRRLDGHGVQNLSKPLTQVDSSLPDRSSESAQTTHPGRFAASSDAKNLPARPPSVDSSGLANVNVGHIIKSNINVNVEIIAAFLCRLFNEPASKKGIYSKLFRDGCNQAEAIHAAAIFTLVHFHQDGTITNPAAVFVARCKAYHKTGIPDEAAELLTEYGDLAYQQLLDALQKPAASSAPSRQGTSPPASPLRPVTPASLPPLPRWGTIPRLIEVSPGRSGMSREDALQVITRAQGDRRPKMCRVDLERLSNGTYAGLLVHTITTIPRHTSSYSLSDWEARTATIKDCFELFGVAPMHRRSWADLLKERGKR